MKNSDNATESKPILTEEGKAFLDANRQIVGSRPKPIGTMAQMGMMMATIGINSRPNGAVTKPETEFDPQQQPKGYKAGKRYMNGLAYHIASSNPDFTNNETQSNDKDTLYLSEEGREATIGTFEQIQQENLRRTKDYRKGWNEAVNNALEGNDKEKSFTKKKAGFGIGGALLGGAISFGIGAAIASVVATGGLSLVALIPAIIGGVIGAVAWGAFAGSKIHQKEKIYKMGAAEGKQTVELATSPDLPNILQQAQEAMLGGQAPKQVIQQENALLGDKGKAKNHATSVEAPSKDTPKTEEKSQGRGKS